MAECLVYNVRSRTLTALNQVVNQYAGVLINAELVVQQHDANNTMRAHVCNTKSSIVRHLDLVKIKLLLLSKMPSSVIRLLLHSSLLNCV
jgi:hypothetical protein